MFNNRRLIYISILPIIIIVLLVLGAGYFLMADDIKLPKFNSGPQIRRLQGFPTNVPVDQGTTAEKQRKVIKSEQELNEFLNSIDKTGLLTMRDKINFEKEFVILISTEVQNPESHKVKIRKVYEDKPNKTLIFSIIETFPGENCKDEMQAHIGVDAVAVDKTDWKIDFERIQDNVNCKDETNGTASPQSSTSNN